MSNSQSNNGSNNPKATPSIPPIIRPTSTGASGRASVTGSTNLNYQSDEVVDIDIEDFAALGRQNEEKNKLGFQEEGILPLFGTDDTAGGKQPSKGLLDRYQNLAKLKAAPTEYGVDEPNAEDTGKLRLRRSELFNKEKYPLQFINGVPHLTVPSVEWWTTEEEKFDNQFVERTDGKTLGELSLVNENFFRYPWDDSTAGTTIGAGVGGNSVGANAAGGNGIGAGVVGARGVGNGRHTGDDLHTLLDANAVALARGIHLRSSRKASFLDTSNLDIRDSTTAAQDLKQQLEDGGIDGISAGRDVGIGGDHDNLIHDSDLDFDDPADDLENLSPTEYAALPVYEKMRRLYVKRRKQRERQAREIAKIDAKKKRWHSGIFATDMTCKLYNSLFEDRRGLKKAADAYMIFYPNIYKKNLKFLWTDIWLDLFVNPFYLMTKYGYNNGLTNGPLNNGEGDDGPDGTLSGSNQYYNSSSNQLRCPRLCLNLHKSNFFKWSMIIVFLIYSPLAVYTEIFARYDQYMNLIHETSCCVPWNLQLLALLKRIIAIYTIHWMCKFVLYIPTGKEITDFLRLERIRRFKEKAGRYQQEIEKRKQELKKEAQIVAEQRLKEHREARLKERVLLRKRRKKQDRDRARRILETKSNLHKEFAAIRKSVSQSGSNLNMSGSLRASDFGSGVFGSGNGTGGKFSLTGGQLKQFRSTSSNASIASPTGDFRDGASNDLNVHISTQGSSQQQSGKTSWGNKFKGAVFGMFASPEKQKSVKLRKSVQQSSSGRLKKDEGINITPSEGLVADMSARRRARGRGPRRGRNDRTEGAESDTYIEKLRRIIAQDSSEDSTDQLYAELNYGRGGADFGINPFSLKSQGGNIQATDGDVLSTKVGIGYAEYVSGELSNVKGLGYTSGYGPGDDEEDSDDDAHGVQKRKAAVANDPYQEWIRHPNTDPYRKFFPNDYEDDSDDSVEPYLKNQVKKTVKSHHQATTNAQIDAVGKGNLHLNHIPVTNQANMAEERRRCESAIDGIRSVRYLSAYYDTLKQDETTSTSSSDDYDASDLENDHTKQLGSTNHNRAVRMMTGNSSTWSSSDDDSDNDDAGGKSETGGKGKGNPRREKHHYYSSDSELESSMYSSSDDGRILEIYYGIPRYEHYLAKWVKMKIKERIIREREITAKNARRLQALHQKVQQDRLALEDQIAKQGVVGQQPSSSVGQQGAGQAHEIDGRQRSTKRDPARAEHQTFALNTFTSIRDPQGPLSMLVEEDEEENFMMSEVQNDIQTPIGGRTQFGARTQSLIPPSRDEPEGSLQGQEGEGDSRHAQSTQIVEVSDDDEHFGEILRAQGETPDEHAIMSLIAGDEVAIFDTVSKDGTVAGVRQVDPRAADPNGPPQDGSPADENQAPQDIVTTIVPADPIVHNVYHRIAEELRRDLARKERRMEKKIKRSIARQKARVEKQRAQVQNNKYRKFYAEMEEDIVKRLDRAERRERLGKERRKELEMSEGADQDVETEGQAALLPDRMEILDEDLESDASSDFPDYLREEFERRFEGTNTALNGELGGLLPSGLPGPIGNKLDEILGGIAGTSQNRGINIVGGPKVVAFDKDVLRLAVGELPSELVFSESDIDTSGDDVQDGDGGYGDSSDSGSDDVSTIAPSRNRTSRSSRSASTSSRPGSSNQILGFSNQINQEASKNAGHDGIIEEVSDEEDTQEASEGGNLFTTVTATRKSSSKEKMDKLQQRWPANWLIGGSNDHDGIWIKRQNGGGEEGIEMSNTGKGSTAGRSSNAGLEDQNRVSSAKDKGNRNIMDSGRGPKIPTNVATKKRYYTSTNSKLVFRDPSSQYASALNRDAHPLTMNTVITSDNKREISSSNHDQDFARVNRDNIIGGGETGGAYTGKNSNINTHSVHYYSAMQRGSLDFKSFRNEGSIMIYQNACDTMHRDNFQSVNDMGGAEGRGSDNFQSVYGDPLSPGEEFRGSMRPTTTGTKTLNKESFIRLDNKRNQHSESLHGTIDTSADDFRFRYENSALDNRLGKKRRIQRRSHGASLMGRSSEFKSVYEAPLSFDKRKSTTRTTTLVVPTNRPTIKSPHSTQLGRMRNQPRGEKEKADDRNFRVLGGHLYHRKRGKVRVFVHFVLFGLGSLAFLTLWFCNLVSSLRKYCECPKHIGNTGAHFVGNVAPASLYCAAGCQCFGLPGEVPENQMHLTYHIIAVVPLRILVLLLSVYQCSISYKFLHAMIVQKAVPARDSVIARWILLILGIDWIAECDVIRLFAKGDLHFSTHLIPKYVYFLHTVSLAFCLSCGVAFWACILAFKRSAFCSGMDSGSEYQLTAAKGTIDSGKSNTSLATPALAGNNIKSPLKSRGAAAFNSGSGTNAASGNAAVLLSPTRTGNPSGFAVVRTNANIGAGTGTSGNGNASVDALLNASTRESANNLTIVDLYYSGVKIERSNVTHLLKFLISPLIMTIVSVFIIAHFNLYTSIYTAFDYESRLLGQLKTDPKTSQTTSMDVFSQAESSDAAMMIRSGGTGGDGITSYIGSVGGMDGGIDDPGGGGEGGTKADYESDTTLGVGPGIVLGGEITSSDGMMSLVDASSGDDGLDLVAQGISQGISQGTPATAAIYVYDIFWNTIHNYGEFMFMWVTLPLCGLILLFLSYKIWPLNYQGKVILRPRYESMLLVIAYCLILMGKISEWFQLAFKSDPNRIFGALMVHHAATIFFITTLYLFCLWGLSESYTEIHNRFRMVLMFVMTLVAACCVVWFNWINCIEQEQQAVIVANTELDLAQSYFSENLHEFPRIMRKINCCSSKLWLEGAVSRFFCTGAYLFPPGDGSVDHEAVQATTISGVKEPGIISGSTIDTIETGSPGMVSGVVPFRQSNLYRFMVKLETDIKDGRVDLALTETELKDSWIVQIFRKIKAEEELQDKQYLITNFVAGLVQFSAIGDSTSSYGGRPGGDGVNPSAGAILGSNESLYGSTSPRDGTAVASSYDDGTGDGSGSSDGSSAESMNAASGSFTSGVAPSRSSWKTVPGIPQVLSEHNGEAILIRIDNHSGNANRGNPRETTREGSGDASSIVGIVSEDGIVSGASGDGILIGDMLGGGGDGTTTAKDASTSSTSISGESDRSSTSSKISGGSAAGSAAGGVGVLSSGSLNGEPIGEPISLTSTLSGLGGVIVAITTGGTADSSNGGVFTVRMELLFFLVTLATLLQIFLQNSSTKFLPKNSRRQN